MMLEELASKLAKLEESRRQRRGSGTRGGGGSWEALA